MLKLGQLLCVGLFGAALVGCRDNTAPVPRVPPPAPGADTPNVNYEPVKPMPGPNMQVAAAPQPFVDAPLLQDVPPEAQRFVQVYQQVGKPRILVFVNRTLEGQIIPSTGGDAGPVRTVERTREATTGVTIENKDFSQNAGPYGVQTNDRGDKFQTTGPGKYTETTVEYLRPGEYDDVQAKAIDYGMMETLLTDWMSAGNQVAVVSPMVAQKPLTEQQAKDLAAGKQMAMQELAAQLDADILVQVQARITKQTPAGLSIRILAEAMNTRGADSLARAAVDMDPPLDKTRLNTYMRFLARKLMDGMATTWSQPVAPPRNAPPAQPGQPGQPVPAPGTGPTTPPPTPPAEKGGLGPRLVPQ